MAKLTETKLKAARPAERPYKLFDANGLYLQVPPSGSPRWRARLTVASEELHVSLGTHPEAGLDDARARAAQLRVARNNGADAPALRALAAELRGAAAPHPVRISPPTGDALEEVVEQWRKHVNGALAASTRECDERAIGYLVFKLGPREPMSTIGIGQLRDAVKWIESEHGRATAKRALRLANALWRYAMVHYDQHVKNNPCSGLPAREVLTKASKKNRAAITEPKAFGALLNAIDGYKGQPVVQLGLQILALTFQRPGELRLAAWSEFDLDAAEPLWTIPKERMKMRESDHLVPLAPQTVALLRELKRHARGELAFPSLRPGKPVSDNTFNAALRTMGYAGNVHVSHGFRATASTLLHQKGFDHDCIEQQLAHKRPGVNGDYNRAHLLEQRRAMLISWANYLDELRQQQ